MQEDIHGLLGKYFNGQASAEETEQVRNWAAASEENAADLRLLENLWNKTGDQEQYVFDTNRAWLTVHAKLQKAKQRPKTIIMFPRRAVAVAAAIILLLGAWWLFYPAGAVHTVFAGTEVKRVNMDDGSTIWLRKGATIEYANSYGKKDRKLNLTGEAFFEVAPDTSLPFIIDAAGSKVQVVGTSFLVNTENKRVELVVRTGRVKFSNAVNEILLTAGERSVDTGQTLVKEINAHTNFRSWQTDTLLFENTALTQVIKDLNNYYSADISIKSSDSAEMAGITFTGRFVKIPLSEVLDILSKSARIRVARVGEKRYEISKF